VFVCVCVLVCVCVCVCVCTHKYIFTYICVYTYKHIYIYTFEFKLQHAQERNFQHNVSLTANWFLFQSVLGRAIYVVYCCIRVLQ